MSYQLEVPKVPGSPTTIHSESPSMEHPPAWPLHEDGYNPFVSPTAHYFNTGGSPRETAYMQYPITFDEKRPIDEKAPLDFSDTNLPQIPPRATLHRQSFYPSGEDVLGPHIVTGRPQKKFRRRFDWKSGIHRLYKSWVDNWWLWELLSWCVSAICMGVIGLVLLLLDDKPTSTNDFTLNSMIAILSGIAKAALLLPTAEALGQLKWSWFWRDSKKVRDFETFDQASRGPWGSLMLLIRTKGKTIATVGAVITILSIAVDPFFQQLVVFPQRWVAHGNGTMPQVQRFDGLEANVSFGGSPLIMADPPLVAFMEPLFYGHPIEPRVPLNCPTSNCTWEPFDSLSVCTACHDISDMLQYDCRETQINWLSNVTNISDTSTLPTARTCGYFLNGSSDDPILMTGYVSKGGDPGLQEVLVSRQLPLWDLDAFKSYWGGSIHFKNRTNPIMDYVSVSAPGGVPSVYGNATPIAQECVINWCTQKLNMTYFIGNLTQEIVGEPTMQTGEAPFPWEIVGEIEGAGTDYHYNANFTFEPPGQDLTFSLTNQTMFESIVLMMEFFPAYMTGRSDQSHLLYRYNNILGLPHPWLREMDSNPHQNATGLNDQIGQIMTKVLLGSFTGANLRVGHAWDLIVYVNVRWIWMSLPFALLFFSLIFLLATIFKSADELDDIGIWKTSALAVLLNGLRGDVQSKMGTPNQMGEARTNAENVRVKLMVNKKGRYRLSGVSGPWNLSPDDSLHGKTWI